MPDQRTDDFNALFNAAPLGIIAIDQAGTIVRANPALGNMFGYDTAELIGRPLEVLLPERLRGRHEAQRRGFMGAPHARPMGQGLDLLGLRRDGRTFPIEVSLTHIDLGGSQLGVAFVADVSTRKQLEDERAQLLEDATTAAQQRAAALAQLHTIVHSAPIGIGFFDADLRFQLINAQLARINGQPAATYLGQSLEEALPDFAADLAPLIRDVIASGEPRIDLEIEGNGPGGQGWRQYLVSYYPVRSGQETIGVGSIVQDVTTERREAEALRLSEQRFRAIFADAPLGMVLATPDRRLITSNPAFQRMLGYTADELAGMGPQDFIHPDDLDRWLHEREAIIAGRQGQTTLVHRFVRKDGATIHGSVTASFVQDGDAQFLLIVVEDVTARMQAEEARARLAAIIDSTDDAIIGTSLDGLIFAWNAGAERLYGYGAAEALGMKRARIVPPERTAELEQVSAAIAGGASVAHLETVRLHKSGRPVEVMLTFSPIRDAGGALIGTSTIAHDIGERKRLERELREERELLARRVAERTADLSLANAELARAARLKDEFLANMSHELRTPLNSILGRSEALQEEIYGPVTPEQVQALRGVEESGRHLLSLINDILDLSKIEAGRLDLSFDTIDVGLLCHASTRLVAQLAITKRVSVSSMVDAQVETIDADERRVKQILVNLLSNAVKFTPPGGRVGLDVQGDPQAQTMTFSVWDTGIGIAADQLPKLFQPFVQLDSSLSRQYEGSGLGLALVLRLTEAHGGSLIVDSTPGVGSRFSVTLPWSPRTAVTRPPRAPAETPAAVPTLRNALVVEDSATAAGHVARYLREFGARVEIHARGADALSRAAELRPDVIILDILLPDVSGWEVLRQLKADPRTAGLPVLVVSVVDDPARARALGAEAFLLKPITRGVLAQTLQQSLRGPAQSAPLQDPPAESRERRPRLLLAEDNQANIDVLQDFLRSRGYDVVVVRSGHEALARVHEEPIDLVLMDIQMPGMDGLEATRHLRADEATRALPVIALTALAMPGDRERCLEAGANAYLAKPVNLRGLLATIEAQLGRAVEPGGA